MDVNVHQLSMRAAGVYLAFAASQPDTARAAHEETGRPGDAGSWRSAKYLQDWGLERMQASQAYAAGYSDSSRSMGGASHSSAQVDNYHLGAYSGHDLRLTVGASHRWHSAQVRRDLQYAAVSAKQKARVTGRSSQLFSEAAHCLQRPALTLEPFANLAYVHPQRDALHEKDDAAALRAGDDSAEALLGLEARLGITAELDLSLDYQGQLAMPNSSTAWG